MYCYLIIHADKCNLLLFRYCIFAITFLYPQYVLKMLVPIWFMYFLFSGAVNTLAVREERYFKPSPSAFVRVAGRGPDAWQIRPGSYFLLPFHQAFHQEIPKDFTFYLTIKPDPESEGILFSLNARHTRQEYISLELNEGRLGLIHSLPNGSKIIDIPAKVSDGQWHQLAIRYTFKMHI